jgi:uncharacterized protein YecE (DUF72 family)
MAARLGCQREMDIERVAHPGRKTPAGRTPASPVRVGCAGWSILSRHTGLFDAGDSHLARYATRFDVVEINSSFYRPHAAKTYQRWAASVPRAFRFSVKLPKAITHDGRLRAAGAALSRFSGEVAGLGNKLGGLLVQLPPSLAFDARTADTFFAVLRRRLTVPVACEPRHPSWFESGVENIWQRYEVARVAADPARIPAASLPGGRGRWHYWRWHGSPRMYYDSYDEDRLRALAHALLAEATRSRVAWCIFDNTAGGHAIANAARLQELLRSAHGTPADTRRYQGRLTSAR